MHLLVEQGALLTQRIPGPPASIEYYSLDGAVKANYLRILPDNDSIELLSDLKSQNPAARAVPRLKASQLMIGGTDVTVRDLLELFAGKLRTSDGYLPAAAITARLDTILTNFDVPLIDKDLASVHDVRDRALLLSDAIEKLLREAQQAPGTTPASLGEQELGKWLERLLAACPPATLGQWGVIDLPKIPVCAASPGAAGPAPPTNWNGYLAGGNNPLAFLASALSKYEIARGTWATKAAALNFTIEKASSDLQTATPVNIEFNQQQWVFSYVTPVTGAAFTFTGGGDSFPLFYLGAQIHLVPNPVESPLWTQDKDYLRAFAVELGMSTTSGPFGPDNRYGRWRGLPPVFVGLALHPIAYTSISGGLAMMGRRSTTVVQEKTDAWMSFYLGANVQINIPDLVVALKGRTSSTTTP
jgi:hypothetical protein